jgi:hypothetical protein
MRCKVVIKTVRILAHAALCIPAVSAGTPLTEAEAAGLFARQVLPLLKAKCLACHGDDPNKIKAGLDLRTRVGLLQGGESGRPALVPGQPDASPMFVAVTRRDKDLQMPPKENDQLDAGQVEWIRQWIAAGAPWPDPARAQELAKAPAGKWDVTGGVAVKTSGGLSPEWTNRQYKPENLWAYQPIKRPSVPALRATQSATRNAIDAFIHEKLAAASLPAAPPADRRALIRRAAFDLLGLPPTPEEIEAFLADPAPDEEAFAKLVERLLASPHYGEQWGRHWLDVVRYADSSGFANDFARGSAWRYRDYVIRAFNNDKPYDRFLREQIAGDELFENAKPESRNPEWLVATGFLRMGPWELTGMEVPKVARQRFLDDVTQTVGETFLGHALQCARCHDHKFDPVPTRDYYAMQAVFATTQLAERPAAFLPQENTTGFDEKKYCQQRRRHYLAILSRLDEKSIAVARAWFVEKKLDPAEFEAALKKVLQRPAGRRGGEPGGYEAVRQAMMKQGIAEDKVPPRHAGFTPEDYGLDRIARKGLERLTWEFDRYEPVAFAVYGGRTPELKQVHAPMRMPARRMTQGELEQVCILAGGDPFSPKERVAPAALSAVAAFSTLNPQLSTNMTGRRLALADWIASPQNPLTARVMVNRIWLWHFGQALAGNPNNFGATGKKPTHPELLDWLAAEFVERGWSVKAMHRLIMNSETYRRAAQHPDPKALAAQDPNGASYAVYKPRRLDAEELRDAMLRVSGELNPALGGIPVRPEMNREAALQPRQVMGTFAEAWQPSPLPAQRHRRSIYALRIRGQRDPFMEVFNAPTPDLACEAREGSTVTPQVFAMFNSQASHDRALAFAARLRKETSSREAAVARAFALACGRPPRAGELRTCLAHWDAMTARHRALKFDRPLQPREVVREAAEENTGGTFVFKEPLDAAADFVPDLQAADAPPELRGLAEVCLVLLNSNEFAYVY